ncbi:uncharacterized protein LOC143277613 [Babylonia areolata]|uniref:uncharacterized protein LOC143277613 n=1 Tax=Babylonia areolata TaxID=304850 RepID=UPI003FD4F0E9
MPASGVILILCGLLQLPRMQCEEETDVFTVDDLSDDGQLYFDEKSSTFSFSFTVHETCPLIYVQQEGTAKKLCSFTFEKNGRNYTCSYYDTVQNVLALNKTVTLIAKQCSDGLTNKTRRFNFNVAIRERPTLLSLTADSQGSGPAVQGVLTVDEDSAVTVRCRWKPGHSPRNATLSRNGTPLPPSRLVTLSPPLEGAGKEEEEGEGEAVNLVEHTVQSFGRQHSGLYACQVEEGGGRRNLTLWIRARSDRNGGLSVVAVSASLSSTVFVSVLLALCILCSRRRKRKMMGKWSGRMTRQRYRESWALAAYRQTPEEEGNMIINTLYEGGPASGQTTKVPVDVLGYSEVQDRVGQASDAAGRVDKGTMLFPSEVDGRYHDINDPRYENPPPPRPHHQLHQPHPHGVRG